MAEWPGHCLQVLRVAGFLATAVIAFVLAAGNARAQETRTAYAPITFAAEAGALRTTACLQLTERVYPSTRWWETAAANEPAPDRAFKSVIAAIKQQDRPALLRLTDPTQARDTADFDRQASAFFWQLQAIQLREVPRAHEFDGLVVYFGKLQSDTQTAFVPLAFTHEGTDVFGFLPSRSKQLTYTLVRPLAEGGIHRTRDRTGLPGSTHRRLRGEDRNGRHVLTFHLRGAARRLYL